MQAKSRMTADGVTLANFEQLYDEYYEPVRGFIAGLVRSRERSEDLAADTFLKAWRSLSRGATIAAPALKPWLYRIARNTAYDWIHRQRYIFWESIDELLQIEKRRDGDRAETATSEAEMTSLCGAAQIGDRFPEYTADRDLLAVILREMRPDYQRLLLLAAEFTYEELMVEMHLDRGAMAMKLSRARKRFRELQRREMGYFA